MGSIRSKLHSVEYMVGGRLLEVKRDTGLEVEWDLRKLLGHFKYEFTLSCEGQCVSVVAERPEDITLALLNDLLLGLAWDIGEARKLKEDEL